jgi:hypothetical protein
MPPPTTPFRAPPQTVTRQKTRTPSRPPPSGRSRVGFADQHGYDDEEFADSPGLFADSPEAQFDRRTALARTRRSSVAYDNYGADIIPARSTRRGSVAYEQRGIDIVPARNTRRDSFYDYEQSMDSGDGSFDEDKYLDAMKYQDDINGGPAMPLTADALRKASNPRLGGGSSRSSGSHDDSEYKRSNTTGLTRSSSSDTDNVTIKVSGSAVVRVSGAEIECGDGGEITFSRPNNGTSRVGSDRASSYYQLEDVQPRVERKALPYRPHTPSRSDSHHRGYSGNHAPYDPSFAMDDYIYWWFFFLWETTKLMISAFLHFVFYLYYFFTFLASRCLRDGQRFTFNLGSSIWLSILVDICTALLSCVEIVSKPVSICFYSWDKPACWFWQKVDTPKSVDSGSFQLMIQFL